MPEGESTLQIGAVSFSNVVIGQRRSLTFKVVNTNDEPLFVRDVRTSTSTPFTVSQLPDFPRSLIKGDLLEFIISFDPPCTASFQEYLYIIPDGNSPTQIVTLDGIGVEPPVDKTTTDPNQQHKVTFMQDHLSVPNTPSRYSHYSASPRASLTPQRYPDEDKVNSALPFTPSVPASRYRQHELPGTNDEVTALRKEVLHLRERVALCEFWVKELLSDFIFKGSSVEDVFPSKQKNVPSPHHMTPHPSRSDPELYDSLIGSRQKEQNVHSPGDILQSRWKDFMEVREPFSPSLHNIGHLYGHSTSSNNHASSIVNTPMPRSYFSNKSDADINASFDRSSNEQIDDLNSSFWDTAPQVPPTPAFPPITPGALGVKRQGSA